MVLVKTFLPYRKRVRMFVLYQQHSVIRGDSPHMKRNFWKSRWRSKHCCDEPVVTIENRQRLILIYANQDYGAEFGIFAKKLLANIRDLGQKGASIIRRRARTRSVMAVIEKLPRASFSH